MVEQKKTKHKHTDKRTMFIRIVALVCALMMIIPIIVGLIIQK